MNVLPLFVQAAREPFGLFVNCNDGKTIFVELRCEEREKASKEFRQGCDNVANLAEAQKKTGREGEAVREK